MPVYVVESEGACHPVTGLGAAATGGFGGQQATIASHCVSLIDQLAACLAGASGL